MYASARTIRISQLSFLRPGLVALLLAVPAVACAQWQLLDPPTTADLRGIDNVGGGVAWASGTKGTVVRTEDGGYLWQHCSTPPGAEKLDFRGIQAFDENTAIVMSSGPGDQSRIYKTTNGCQSWTLLFNNPDPAGFWDVVRIANRSAAQALVLGDPVDGHFARYQASLDGKQLQPLTAQGPRADAGEGLFAASNTSLDINSATHTAVLGTGDPLGARILVACGSCQTKGLWESKPLPGFAFGKSAGIFSVKNQGFVWQAVGGDYRKPNDATGIAAYSLDNAATWHLTQTSPHGYRSAVAYDADHKTWITVGPNGTDISTDDGRTWRPLIPSAADHDAPDADQHWNALSLPFVVGPNGRIGKLRGDALPESAKTKQTKP